MKIAFLMNHVYINDGWSPYDTRLGGTEEGVVQWSTLLSDAGHDVTVFQNGFIGDFEGVEYRNRDDYDSVAQYGIMREDDNKCLGVNETKLESHLQGSFGGSGTNRENPEIDVSFVEDNQPKQASTTQSMTEQPSTISELPALAAKQKKKIEGSTNAPYFDVTFNHKALDKSIIGKTFYFTTETDATGKDLSRFDAVVWPSYWAKDNIPVNNDRVEVVNYGYDPDKIYLSEGKIPKQCLYASSPDRGLDTLLELWPKVVEAHPDAQLIVTYGAEARDIPNVTFLGEVDEETMNDLYMSSEYWLHPCNGGELFGITGVKAQAAGCWPIYFPTMALAETVKYGDACKNADEMTKMIIKRMNEAIPPYEVVWPLPTWESTAQDILNLVTISSPPRIEGR